MTDTTIDGAPAGAATTASSGAAEPGVTLTRRVALECDAMARHALGTGLKLPDSLTTSLELIELALAGGAVPLATLATIHSQLADVVAPAAPRTIYLLQVDQANQNWKSCLGPLPSIRRLVIGAAFFTSLFVLSSLSGAINHANLASDIYSLDGIKALLVLIFLMSAAAMGGCFHALFIAHGFIGAGTYDPNLESSYWIRIGMGLIAGLVLSQMIPLGPEVNPASGTAPAASSAETFSKPLLALLGGFSATLVYTILQRLVETVESLFKVKTEAAAPSAIKAPATAVVPPTVLPDANAARLALPAPASDATPAPSSASSAATTATVAALAAATTAAA
ncbi:hypothetical protein N825_31690, partial [Skermanella stibiiresistens SB22]